MIDSSFIFNMNCIAIKKESCVTSVILNCSFKQSFFFHAELQFAAMSKISNQCFIQNIFYRNTGVYSEVGKTLTSLICVY